MEKNQRQKIYDWLVKNEHNQGAEYKEHGKEITVPYHDYVRIGSRIRQRYKFATYQTLEHKDDVVTMRIAIL